MESILLFVKVILIMEIGLFVFFLMALGIKIIERLKELKNDKYKDIEK